MVGLFLTVAIPIYNAELYLEECIDLILSQSMKDYEILLVNNGSTDNTSSISDIHSINKTKIITSEHLSSCF